MMLSMSIRKTHVILGVLVAGRRKIRAIARVSQGLAPGNCRKIRRNVKIPGNRTGFFNFALQKT